MGKIFAGLIFVFLYIHIGPLDLLPAEVGYILIWMGMKELGRRDGCWVARTGGSVVIAALCVQVAGRVLSLFGGLEGLNFLLGLAALACQILVTYRVNKCLRELEQITHTDLNGKTVERTWRVMEVFVALHYPARWLDGGFTLFLSLTALVCVIVYLVQFGRAWRFWEQDRVRLSL